MRRAEWRTLRALTLAPGTTGRFIADETCRVALDGLRGGSALVGDAGALLGRSVLVQTHGQLASVLAMVELDGIAGRMLLCPPDLPDEHMDAIMAEAEVDAVVTDSATGQSAAEKAGLPVLACRSRLEQPAWLRPDAGVETEWVLFTSGTTGRPKMVRHTLHSLTGHLAQASAGPDGVTWSTFYDVRRYGGLSILVRALLGPASMVLSSATESVAGFLRRAAEAGVTHMSGTPSHWRRALMSPAISAMTLRNVRISGEIADQAILDRTQAAFPGARVTHAFASTEAGVAFEVTDGLAGFPAAMLEGEGLSAELRLEGGTLRIRSARAARGYVGRAPRAMHEYVDTGDLVERRGNDAGSPAGVRA